MSDWERFERISDPEPQTVPVLIRDFAPSSAPDWLQRYLDWPAPHVGEIVAPFKLWLPGDENRLLPMPLRYAATHPQSPQAIMGVLSGGERMGP